MPNADEIGLYDHDEDDDGEDMDMDLMEDTSDEDEDEDEDEMSEDDNVETEILNMGSTVPDSDDESIDLTPIKKVSEPKPKPSKPSKAAVKVVKASKPIKSKSVEKRPCLKRRRPPLLWRNQRHLRINPDLYLSLNPRRSNRHRIRRSTCLLLPGL